MSDSLVRLTIFLFVLTSMVLLEHLIPDNKEKRKTSTSKRWFNHFCLVALGTLLSRLILPMGLVGISMFGQQYALGLFNLLNLPYVVSIVFGVVLLDLIIYWQHRLFHKVPILWRLHRVHHIDPNLDTTSALRFHPVEIVLSLLVKTLVVVLFGIPIEAIILFEVALSSFALFNHSNISLPKTLDRILKKVLITPSLHRVHHSVLVEESNTNFGFSVSLWDRLFATYRDYSAQGDKKCVTGVEGFDGKNESFIALLTSPFKNRSI